MFLYLFVFACICINGSNAGRLMKSIRSAAAATPVAPLIIKSTPAVQIDKKVDGSATSPLIVEKEKSTIPSNYLLTVCEAGEEKALKAEIAKNHPSLRLAFSRPGFVTFKLPQSATATVEDVETNKKVSASYPLNAVYARQFAASLGSSLLIDDVIVKAKALLASDPDSTKRLRLHVWGRSEVMPAAGHPLAIGAAKMRVNQIRELLLGCDDAASLWLPCHDAESAAATASDSSSSIDDSRDIAREGEHVFDVIVPTGPFISEALHIGHHMHFSAPRTSPHMIGHSAWPGGNPKVVLPQEAPSRAYLKIEEALR